MTEDENDKLHELINSDARRTVGYAESEDKAEYMKGVTFGVYKCVGYINGGQLENQRLQRRVDELENDFRVIKNIFAKI